ncbi:hypothetical protein Lal_00011233 [Lupinus albus]|nr:hypothetical protein Lal_00011233 [Lupinus albus]
MQTIRGLSSWVDLGGYILAMTLNERYRMNQRYLHVVSIDLEKACNKVPKKVLCNTLEKTTHMVNIEPLLVYNGLECAH